MNDKELAEFTAMYDGLRTRVWGYVTTRVGRQAADEVVSETFTIAWRRFHDIPDPPLPWLLGVARNVVLDTYRAEARRQLLTAELQGWTDPAALVTADVGEMVADRLVLLGALASLSDDDREALILVAWQGLTPHEAARVTGLAAPAMRVRLHRARKRLRRALTAASEPARGAAGHYPRTPVPARKGVS